MHRHWIVNSSKVKTPSESTSKVWSLDKKFDEFKCLFRCFCHFHISSIFWSNTSSCMPEKISVNTTAVRMIRMGR